MSAWQGMTPRARVLILGAAGLLLLGAGYLGWQVLRPVPEPAASLGATPDPAPTTEVTPTPEVTPEPAPVAQSSLPKIDVWRVAPDGGAVVSGLATAGSRVEVIVDGLPMAEGEAGASGEFALVFTLPPNPEPSLLWVAMTVPDAGPVSSAEMVALGPIAGPEVPTEPAPAQLPELAAEEPAPATPPALLLTEAGAVVLQEAEPASRDNVMIDTITYTPAGEVQVGGRAGPGSVLRVYLDNQLKAELTTPGTGLWLADLPETAPGIYMLRVDQLDPAGAVASRFETPFKRETLEALAAVSTAPTAPTADAAPDAAPEPLVVAEAAPAAEAPAAEQVAAPEVAAAETPAAEAESVVPATEPAAAEPTAAESTAAEPESTDAAPEQADSAPEPTDAAPEPTETTPQPSTAPAAPPVVTVTVQPGFTLWGIAQERYGNGVLYVQVFEANRDKIRNPDLIYPGQVLSVPGAAVAP